MMSDQPQDIYHCRFTAGVRNSMDLIDIFNVDPDQLTEDEKDEACQTLSQADLEKLIDPQDWKNAVKLLQGLLKFKAEQVVSLTLELDELASKQGEEEAHFVQEIEDLRSQLSKIPREHIQNGDTQDDLRQLLHESENNAQRLLAEVQAQEQEQVSNKMEMEKLESQLAVLENDRLLLKRELAALQEEIQDQHKEVESDAQEPKKKHRQLVESLRQKNKHLSSLLNDVEASEKENIALREKLTNIKIELSEATKNIMHTTGEIVTLQVTKEEQTEKIRYLEQMCEALRQQVKELVLEKEKRDSELETFQQEIDVRVEEWKKIVAMKEKELNDLHDQLAHQSVKGQYIMKSCESDQIVLLSQTLQKRESQIDELQSQLSQATKDLNETTSLLENMHRASELSQVDPHTQDTEVSPKQLLAAEEKIKILEEKLRNAEEDADGKSEEITKMIIQLRSYEAGEFGLTEALDQIKELSQQRTVRDKHIEQLVETANQLRNTYDSLQEENLTLREKLHISPDEHVKTSSKVLKSKEDNVVLVQQQQIDRLEEDLISAKMDRRSLTQQVLALSKHLESENQTHEVPKTSSKHQTRSQADARAAARKIRALQQEQHQSSIERQSLIEENEALRQGLHDILDSVHNQDGKSNVRLESKVLEHLLHALDSRHISGWYHPAMRIQAKVNAVEGNNEALREQLHSMREEESRTQNELHRAKLRIAELEEISKIPSNNKDFYPSHTKTTDFKLPSEISSQGLDVITKMNKHLLQVLHELELDKTQVAETLSIQKELQLQLEELVLQLAFAVQQHNVDKENWLEEKSDFEKQRDLLQANLASSDAKVHHLTALWDKFSVQDEAKVKDIFDYVSLKAENERCDRMAKAAQHWADNSKAQVQIIKSEWNASKQWIMKKFGDLLQFKRNSLTQLSELELMLMNSVPLSSLKAANKRADELSAKYEELLRQHEILVNKADKEAKKFMAEMELERKLKHDLSLQFESLNKKLWAKSLPSDTSVQELGARLAGLEGEVIREKQLTEHAEKMCEIVKEEVKQVSKRCEELEVEVLALLNTNQKLKLELAQESSSPPVHHLGEKSDVETELAAKKAEVLDLQASRKHLQELADISHAQVEMLDQLHQRSELQLDSLRQVLYKLQGETDLGFEIARLGEELCAAQIRESAAWNQISSLERQRNEALSLNDKLVKEIEDLEIKINTEKLSYVQQYKKMQEKIIAARDCSKHNLSPFFFHLVVRAFAQRSEECRHLWQDLQTSKAELAALALVDDEKKVSCQQTLELQNALMASHSDLDCQRMMESWANSLTEFKIKDLKSSRQFDVMKATLKQTEERLESQERLLSSIEQQLLALDIKKLPITSDPNFGGNLSQESKKVTQIEKTVDIDCPLISLESNLKSKPIEINVESPPSLIQPPTVEAMDRKELQENEVLLKDEIKILKEEIKKLMELLRANETELVSYKKTCSDLQNSLQREETSWQTLNQDSPKKDSLLIDSLVNKKTEKNDSNISFYDKVALQATIESLQNIIIQKEDTIYRYQRFLRDVREEDARIISGLQEHLRAQQTELTAQEKAYVRLKISTRHLALEANADINSKTCLESHLARASELEDEVVLLKARVSSLLIEVQNKQQDASYWSSVAQQHFSTIEDLNKKLLEHKRSDKRPSFCLPSPETALKNSSLVTSNKTEQDVQEKVKGLKAIDAMSKFKSNQMQMQVNGELTDLRNKLLQMQEQERQYKNEIQRLRDQIPIYSRRTQQVQSGPLRPEREEELLKKIACLEQQLERQKAEHEKIMAHRDQLETKKLKSVENVARWDERKKHQLQIEKLKISIQEQTEETVLLHDKVERLNGRVHRLEREKQALEQQIRNLHHIQQDKAILEEQLKKMEGSHLTQCMFDEIQRDRDKLCAEVEMLKTKDALRDQRYQGERHSDNVQKERAELLKANLELECENLEIKLELEKLHSETMCLRHKVTHLERLLLETREHRTRDPLPCSTQDSLVIENKILQQKVLQLSQQLDNTDRHLKALENNDGDNSKITALQIELNHKCSLLGKVKTLLERAAIKERQLSEQVLKLEAMIAKK